jgi:hypothetical protein
LVEAYVSKDNENKSPKEIRRGTAFKLVKEIKKRQAK